MEMERDIDRMTVEHLLKLLRSDKPIARARAVFYSECARLEQADAQRKPPNVYERRRMEFKAVIAIAKELGVEL